MATRRRRFTAQFKATASRRSSNTDQGSQFTSRAFTGQLEAAGIRCLMDGRGRCLDNVFIERLWRSLKYEAVYLHELADGFAAQRVIAEWMEFYNEVRPPLGAGRADASGGVLRRGGAGRAGGVARWEGVQTASTGNGASGCAPRSGSCPHIHRGFLWGIVLLIAGTL